MHPCSAVTAGGPAPPPASARDDYTSLGKKYNRSTHRCSDRSGRGWVLQAAVFPTPCRFFVFALTIDRFALPACPVRVSQPRASRSIPLRRGTFTRRNRQGHPGARVAPILIGPRPEHG